MVTANIASLAKNQKIFHMHQIQFTRMMDGLALVTGLEQEGLLISIENLDRLKMLESLFAH